MSYTYNLEKPCLNSTLRVGSGGYPIYKQKPQHRYIYKENYGPIAKGLVVRHKCDNRLCIEPSHLELGTNADNMRDMVERGRSRKGRRAAISDYDIEMIRKMIFHYYDSEIAEMFQISKTTVDRIVRRKHPYD